MKYLILDVCKEKILLFYYFDMWKKRYRKWMKWKIGGGILVYEIIVVFNLEIKGVEVMYKILLVYVDEL